MTVKSKQDNLGFCAKLRNSTVHSFIGFILFFCSALFLYLNEGNYVAKSNLLHIAYQKSTYLDVGYKAMFDNKLVHHSGYLTSVEDLTDTYFRISFPCIKLQRTAEMFQYEEHNSEQENTDGETITTYYYTTLWSSNLIDSRTFDEEIGHQNPRSFLVQSKLFSTSNVFIDGIKLSKSLIDKVNHFKDIKNLPFLPYAIELPFTYYENYYYLGSNAANPQIGDIRISFKCAGITQSSIFNELLPEKITVLAKYNRDSFSSYHFKELHDYIELLHYGDKTIDEVFSFEHTANYTKTWMVRIFGFFMMFASFYLMTNIVYTVISWIPFVQNIVSAGLFIINLSCAFFFSMLVISVSWLWFRPAYSLAIALVALTPWILSFVLNKRKFN